MTDNIKKRNINNNNNNNININSNDISSIYSQN